MVDPDIQPVTVIYNFKTAFDKLPEALYVRKHPLVVFEGTCGIGACPSLLQALI